MRRMHPRTRRVMTAVLGLALFGLLPACAPKPAAEPPKSQPAPAAPAAPAPAAPAPAAPAQPDPSKIEAQIVVWGWDPVEKGVKLAMDSFASKYPGIKVKVEQMGFQDAHDRLLAALAAGQGAPDVAEIEINFIAKFATRGGLTNLLDAPFNAGKYKDQFVQYKWDQATSPDGRLVALPWDIGPATLFYRRDIFQQAGFPSEPEAVAQLLKTWDDFVAVGQKITVPGKRWMIPNANDIFGIYYGNSHKDLFDQDYNIIFNGPVGQRALAAAIAARKAGIDSQMQPWGTEWTAAFQQNAFATVIGGSWMGGFLKTWLDKDRGDGAWGVAPLPSDPGQNWGGSFLAIPAQSANKQAAWLFVEHMLANSEVQNAIMKATDQFPSFKPAWKDPLYDQPDPFFGNQKTRRLWIEIADKIAPPVVTPMDNQAETILMDHVGRCVEAGAAPKACLDAAAKDVEQQVAADKKVALKLKGMGKQ